MVRFNISWLESTNEDEEPLLEINIHIRNVKGKLNKKAWVYKHGNNDWEFQSY
jgi:hypothetical protein